MRTRRKQSKNFVLFPWNFNIRVEYMFFFPSEKAVSHILASIFFSFEVFDVFKNIERSFSLDFCFLIFLILVCALA